MKTSILLLLLPFLVFSQVGINTQTFLPGEMFRVAIGTVAYENIPLVTTSEFVMVTDSEGKQKKMLLSSLTANSGQCPNFLRSQSSGYNLYFSSPSSVPNPNNPLTIQGKNFTPNQAFITGNTYFYGWNNTTGQPINITNLTVNFSGLTCNYQ
jgi:hypothetical protein